MGYFSNFKLYLVYQDYKVFIVKNNIFNEKNKYQVRMKYNLIF